MNSNLVQVLNGVVDKAFDSLPLGDVVRRRGRRYPVPSMVKAFLLSSFRELRSEADMVRYLRARPMEAQSLGFYRVPHRTTFHRFRRHYGWLLEKVCGVLRQMLPHSGVYGVDATLEWKPTDPDAERGYSDSKGWVCGFKLHLLTDLRLGLPVRVAVTTANRHDSPLLPTLVAGNGEGVYVADAGYDSEANHQAIAAEDGFPAICRNRRRGDQKKDTLRNRLKHNRTRKRFIKWIRWKVEPQNELFKDVLALPRRLCRGLANVRFYAQLTLCRLLVQAAWALTTGQPHLRRKTSHFRHR